jgi:hypothetical protein
LELDKPRDVWVTVIPIHFPKLTGTRMLAVQLNAPSVEEATEIRDRAFRKRDFLCGGKPVSPLRFANRPYALRDM